jgi:phosphoglycolate phosphatase
MKELSLVLFDVDGVLLDSLTPHLQICKDKRVRKGIRISPMKYFFEAVGFPSKYADLAFLQYKETFIRDYSPKPFPQIDEMLFRLTSAGLRLGIVTSNVRANVDAALGLNMRFFHPECIFTKEDTVIDSKVDAILSAAKNLGVNIIEVIYVGDQPSDWIAAKEAGANFLGVTYGWGISDEDKDFSTVDKVMGIAEYILDKAKRKCS